MCRIEESIYIDEPISMKLYVLMRHGSILSGTSRKRGFSTCVVFQMPMQGAEVQHLRNRRSTGF